MRVGCKETLACGLGEGGPRSWKNGTASYFPESSFASSGETKLNACFFGFLDINVKTNEGERQCLSAVPILLLESP